MTLLEVLTASALFALLLGGMASSVYLARMTAYEAGDNSTSTSEASSALFWMSQDIGEAVSIEQATEDRLAITVPDRDGDGAGEAIVYSWVAASSLIERRINGGTQESLVTGLSDFDFGYILRTETTAGAVTYGPEQLLASYNSTSNLNNTAVTSLNHRGQYIEPTLPAEAVSWIASRARLSMRESGTNDGQLIIQLRSAVGRKPGGEILAEVELREKKLSGSYAWVDIRFKPATEAIAAGQGVCLVVQGAAADAAGELRYRDSNSTGDGDFLRSNDGGLNWTAPPEQDLLFEMFGTVGAPASNVTQSYLKQVTFRAVLADSARVVYGSARVLNEPKVGN
jgi:hypothetical protein